MDIQNNQQHQIGKAIKLLHQKQSKIPPLIEDMEGMKEYDMKDYYVKLKTVIKGVDNSNLSAYEEVAGEKINIEINNVFDRVQNKDPVTKILILGGAGVGKSTLMSYMSYKWSTDSIWENKFDLVYRLTLKTLLNIRWKEKYLEDKISAQEIEKFPLKFFIHHNIIRIAEQDSPASKLSPEDIDLSNQSRILLLLDGYDEVAHLDDPLFKKLMAQIFYQPNLILTSRPNSVSSQFKAQFERIIENTGLDSDGIDLYISIYFKEKTPEVLKKYIAIDKLIQTNASIKNICNVPVNIAMLCYIFQETQDSDDINIYNMSQLYQEVVKKLGERFMSKEYKGSINEGQSLKHKIEAKLKHLPEIKAIKHIAYSGMTGGGVEVLDNKRKESLIIKCYKDSKDENGTSIQKSIDVLNLETNIHKILKYGLIKQDGVNSANNDYQFIHLSFQEYLTAQFFYEKLTTGSEKEIFDIITYLSTHRNEPRLQMTLKFLAGIISNQDSIEVMKHFWNAMICNVEGVLEFNLEQKVKLLMNVIGQAKRQGDVDQRIPNINEVRQLIDAVVINNISSFKETLKDSDYISDKILKLISSYVSDSKDLSSEILMSMRFNENKNSIQLVLNYIIDSRREQDEIKDPQVLKLIGLELMCFIPHKFDQDMIATSILAILNDDNTFQINKIIALTIFNSIAPKLKGEKIQKLKQNVLEYILSNKTTELFDISIESLKYLYTNQQHTFLNLTERTYSLLNHILTFQLKGSTLTFSNISELTNLLLTQNPTNTQISQQNFQLLKNSFQFIENNLLNQEEEQEDEEVDVEGEEVKAKEEENQQLEKMILFFPKIVEFSPSGERQTLVKNLLKQMQRKMIDGNANQRKSGCMFIPVILKQVEQVERSLLANDLLKTYDKLFSDKEIEVREQACQNISKIFEYVYEKSTLINSTLLSLQNQLKDDSVILYSSNSIVNIFKNIHISERFLHVKGLFKCIEILLEAKNPQIIQDSCRLVHQVLELVEENEKSLLAQSILPSMEKKLLDLNNANRSFIQQYSIKIIFKFINQSERSFLAKNIFKQLENQLSNQNPILLNSVTKFISEILAFIDDLDRVAFARDLFQLLEKMLFDGNIKVLCSVCWSIKNTFDYFDNNERTVVAKQFLKYFEKLLENENINVCTYACELIPFVLCSIDINQRLLLTKETVKSLQKLTVNKIQDVRSQAYQSIQIIIEFSSSQEKSLLAKETIIIFEKFLNDNKGNGGEDGGDDEDDKFSLREITKESMESIIKILKCVNTNERSQFAQNLIENLQKTSMEQFVLAQKAIEYIDFKDRILVVKKLYKFVEEYLDVKSMKSRNMLYNFLSNSLECLGNTIERQSLAQEFLNSYGKKMMELDVSDQMVTRDINFYNKAMINIYDISFMCDERKIRCKNILDILFKNKTKSFVDQIKKIYLTIFSQIQVKYQAIEKMFTIGEEGSKINLDYIIGNAFVDDICKCFLLNKDTFLLKNGAAIKNLKTSSKTEQVSYAFEILSFLKEMINIFFDYSLGFQPHKMIHLLLGIIGYESDDISDRKEVVKAAKATLDLILKHLDQFGVEWIQYNLSGLSELSNYSKVVVSKVCNIILEDGVISDNESFGGYNEFIILVDIIKSGGNILLNDRGSITVDGRRYNLQFDENGQISLDKVMSDMIRNHKNPFIKQYIDNNTIFQNSSHKFEASVDKIEHSIVDNEWNFRKWNSIIDSNWRLIELESYQGGKIIFFEKRNIFGKRIVLKIDESEESDYTQTIIKIFNNDKIKIFGKYSGPQMFFTQLSQHDSWKENSKDIHFISSYNNKDKLTDLVISEKQVLFHDGLLCMSVTSDRMQDIVFFEFMKTIKDSEEELKQELRKINLQEHEKQFLEYYSGFMKTFSLCYTESQVIVSGKFNLDAKNGGVVILSKLASALPLIGDVASSAISSIGEFIQKAGMIKRANSFLQFAYDHSHLSKKVGELAKQIILSKGNELSANNFQRGYVDIFTAKGSSSGSQYALINSISNKLSEIAKSILNIKNGIEKKIFSELYAGAYSKLGNQDASYFIDLITNSGLSNDKEKQSNIHIQKLDSMYNDIGYKYNDKLYKKKQEKGDPQESNCCNLFMVFEIKYDNPFLNLNHDEVARLLMQTQKSYLDMLNLAEEVAQNEKDEILEEIFQQPPKTNNLIP